MAFLFRRSKKKNEQSAVAPETQVFSTVEWCQTIRGLMTLKKLVFNPVVCVMCGANVREPTKRVHTKDQLEYYEVDEVDPAKSVKQMFDELSRKILELALKSNENK